jgi:2,4-dienoyl-CoA reductase-like NADH-dependent reductase (Old Yellow Enzyme family)
MMEHVIASGKGDLISMCRSFIREPDLINPWLSGDTSPSQCDSCDGCLRATKRSEKFQCVVTIRASGTPKKGA